MADPTMFQASVAWAEHSLPWGQAVLLLGSGSAVTKIFDLLIAHRRQRHQKTMADVRAQESREGRLDDHQERIFSQLRTSIDESRAEIGALKKELDQERRARLWAETKVINLTSLFSRMLAGEDKECLLRTLVATLAPDVTQSADDEDDDPIPSANGPSPSSV